jgi:hypothetical protein
MELYRVSIPKDIAWQVICHMGERNFAHFIDLNKNEKVFNLPYSFRIKMCDEAERKLAYLLYKSKELNVPCTRPLSTQIQNDAVTAQSTEMSVATELIFDAFEQKINKYEGFVQEQSKRIGEMQADIFKKIDMLFVLTFVAKQSN